MAKTVKITERELNRIIQEEINDFKEPILTERRDGTLLVEMARINKWIHSKDEAKEAFGYSESEINSVWNKNLKIGIGEGKKLLGLPMGA